MPPTHGPISPPSSTLVVPGTWNQPRPVTRAAARSLAPTPVAKAPRAPWVTMRLSAPTTSSPGRMRPPSANSTWEMPERPPWKRCSRWLDEANSFISLVIRALPTSLLGVKWSATSTTRDGSKTLSPPISLKPRMAMGVETSLARTMSNSASTMAPGSTYGSPAREAKIFWLMVWGWFKGYSPGRSAGGRGFSGTPDGSVR